jgi:hypothetical protein
LKKYFPLALFTAVFFYCVHSNAAPAAGRPKMALEDSARAILKRNMAAPDFTRLGWHKTVVAYFNNQPAVLEIPDNKDAAQHLVFTYISAMPVYHWVKYISIGTDKVEQPVGMLVLTDIHNHILQTYKTEGIFVKGDNLSPQAVAQPVRIQSTYPDYWFNSLYWAFNQNIAYQGLYSGVSYPMEIYGPKGTYRPKTGIPGQTDIVNIYETPTRSVEGGFKLDYTTTPVQ